MPDEPLDPFATSAPDSRTVGALDLTAYRQRLAALAAQGIYISTRVPRLLAAFILAISLTAVPASKHDCNGFSGPEADFKP